MNLENKPHEISQAKKDKYCVIDLYEVPRVVKLIETVNERLLGTVRREGNWGVIV